MFIKHAIEHYPNLSLIQELVEDLVIETVDDRMQIRGIQVRGGAVYHASAVVLTTGTFLQAIMHTGEAKTPGGRAGEGTSSGISGALNRLGFELDRFKTGTPPRLNAKDDRLQRRRNSSRAMKIRFHFRFSQSNCQNHKFLAISPTRAKRFMI